MGHHGNNPAAVDEMMAALRDKAQGGDILDTAGQRLNANDEGRIDFQIVTDVQRGLVHLKFDKPVAWMSASPEQARDLALELRRAANRISRKGTRDPKQSGAWIDARKGRR